MAFLIAGWTESQDSAVLVNVAALADQHLTVSGDVVRVPTFATLLLGAFALGPNVTRVQLLAPSLRRIFNVEVSPIDVAALPSTPSRFAFLEGGPIALLPDEDLTAQAAEDAAGASRATVLVLLGDAPVAPVTGEIFTIRVTNTTTLTANAWTNGALTFDQTLPPGEYAVVGAQFRSTNLQAFRLVFVGGNVRPGGIGVAAVSGVVPAGQRFGGWGEWGRFAHTTPPTVDFLANGADTSQVGELDLIKVA